MAGSGPQFERRQLEPSKIFLLNSFHSKLRMKKEIDTRKIKPIADE